MDIEDIQDQEEILIERAEERGALEERNRILDELEKADLPIGVWPLIRNIICPPNNLYQRE